MDLSAWLRNLGLGQYEQAFRDNAIEADVLLQLTAEDLKELGVTLVGHRRKLLDAIVALRASQAPTSDDARDARILSASPVDAIGERRQVTVLFADLAGYTAWGQQLDAEEVHALLEQFFDCADRAVQEHGGRIDKHIGDCVMGVFGAPVAHGDDAERAARAALAIRAAVPEVSARVRRPDPEGRRPYLGALLLAYYNPDGQLVYAGRSGTGINTAELERLWSRLQPLAADKMPLDVPPPRSSRFGSPLVLSRVH